MVKCVKFEPWDYPKLIEEIIRTTASNISER